MDEHTNGSSGQAASAALVPARAWGWLLAAAGLGSLIAGAVTGDLRLTVGLAIFFALILLPLRLPFETALLILATGWLPIEDLTGAEKDLFAFAGGLNVSGMRLLGGTLGLLIAVWALRGRLRSVRWPRWVLAGAGAYVLAVGWSALTLLWTPDFVEGARGVCKLGFPLLAGLVIAADPRGLGIDALVRRTATVLAAALVAGTLYGFAGALEPALLEPSETHEIANWWGWAGAGSYAFFAGIIGILFVALAAHRLFRRAWLFAAVALVQVPFCLKRLPVGAVGAALSWMVAWGGARRLLAPVGVILAAACLLFFPPLVANNVYTDGGSDSAPAQSIDAVGKVADSPGDASKVVRFEGREQLWRIAIDRVVGIDWVRGNGMNAWAAVARDSAAAGQPLSSGGETQLHGEPVRLIFELGLLGLALTLLPFAIFTIFFAVVCVRTRRRTLQRALAEAALGVSAFYVLSWITDNTLDYYLIGAYAWTVFALASRAVAEEPLRPRSLDDTEGAKVGDPALGDARRGDLVAGPAGGA